MGFRSDFNESHHMRPLSDIDTQETLSFLPDAPVVQIEVPKRKKKPKCCGFDCSCCRCCFNCQPWVLKSLAFLLVFASVLGVKFYLVTRDPPLATPSSSDPNDVSSFTDGKISKWGDMSLADIQQWCLQPNTTTCKCANPLQPAPRHGYKTWTDAHKFNVKLAKNHNADRKSTFRETDVVFLGDSIIEGWIGNKFGRPNENKAENVQVFDSLFDMDHGGEFDGIALGISGDKSQNLLWRIQNGEMPTTLKSHVYWVLIGTNDFLKGKEGEESGQCGEEVVFMGIRRILEEMMKLRPNSIIVVNGLLPRSDIGRKTDGRLYVEDELTVMDGIEGVNRRLQGFVQNHTNLEYFDPLALFTETDPEMGEGKYGLFIPTGVMMDRLHPTPAGYKKWGKKIVERLRLILDGKLNLERR